MSKEKYVELPERYKRRELNARYREIPLKDTTSRLLRKYFSAMANLYGVIPLRKAKEIILSLSPGLVTGKEFLAFAEVARHECEDYYILGGEELFTNIQRTKPLDREIISADLLIDSVDSIIKMKHRHGDKPYYVPDKKQLLEYCDPGYCEDTPEKLALREFLKERCGLSDEQEEVVFMYLLFDIRSVDAEFSDVFDDLEKIGIRLGSQQDVERFVNLYTAFHNSTRMPCNRGYTPQELARMKPLEERLKSVSLGSNIRKLIQNGEIDVEDIRDQIRKMELPDEEIRANLLKQLAEIKPPFVQPEKEQKVGRNALCPCGSGKKYKKCCGK